MSVAEVLALRRWWDRPADALCRAHPEQPEEASPSRASRRSTLLCARLSVGLSLECAKTSESGRVRKRESLLKGRKAPSV